MSYMLLEQLRTEIFITCQRKPFDSVVEFGFGVSVYKITQNSVKHKC
jgi:hypothetical protein